MPGFGNFPTTKPAPAFRCRPNLSLSPPYGTRLPSTASNSWLTPLPSPAPSRAAGAVETNWSLFPLPPRTENFCGNCLRLTRQHKQLRKIKAAAEALGDRETGMGEVGILHGLPMFGAV